MRLIVQNWDQTDVHSHRTLQIWDEAVGVLKKVDFDSGKIVFTNFSVLLTPFLLKKFFSLPSLVGKYISILRTDLNDRPVLLKVATMQPKEMRKKNERKKKIH